MKSAARFTSRMSNPDASGLMSYIPGNGVPSRTLTSNLEFRTLLLCGLSYGDEESCRLQKLYRYLPSLRVRPR